MLDVFLTADVEIWCDGWQNIDNKFPLSFQQYIYGKTANGNYGLPFYLELLNKYNLACTFFVEPLFATRFGIEPLKEIVKLIQDANQTVELHIHTEWINEGKPPILPNIVNKKQFISYFSAKEQQEIIATGLRLLYEAGAEKISAFRAGSFAFNCDTLSALKANNILFDCSYNATLFGQESGIKPGEVMNAPFEYDGIFEYPMSVYNDGTTKLRHAQLTACSYSETIHLLNQAFKNKHPAFVFLFHNFELLNKTYNLPDDVVIKRFLNLCRFLDKNRTQYTTKNFKQLQPELSDQKPEILTSPLYKTAQRMGEQLYRRKFN